MMALWDIKSSEVDGHQFIDIVPVEILAEFDGPLTFTFRDKDGVLILAHLCAVGVGKSRYLTCKTNDISILDLKNGMISIRSALLHPPLWIVDILGSGKVDRVWKTTADELPEGAIPSSEVLLTPELEDLQLADERLAKFAKSGSDGQIAFDGAPVANHAIDIGFYGRFCQSTNELFAEICKSMSLKPPILRAGMTSESSYAVDLKVAEPIDSIPSMWPTKEETVDVIGLRNAFDYLMSMIVDDQPSADSIVRIKRFPELRQRYGDVLELVSQSGVEVAVRTRSDPRNRKMSRRKAGDRLKAVRELGYPFTFLKIRGRLIGGLVEKAGKTDRNFVIRVQLADEIEDFKGDVSGDAVNAMQAVKFGDEVVATLRIQRNQEYTLTGIQSANNGSPHAIS